MERRSAETVGDGVVVLLILLIPQAGLWEKTKFVAVVAVASWQYLPCHPSLTKWGKNQRLELVGFLVLFA